MRATFLTSILFVFAVGCGSDTEAENESEAETSRCATCGMMVAPDDGWRAGTAGEAFDSPKCLFRHMHRGRDASDAWVIEYYSQERRPAREMLYVTGTDLESPMGRDLVPVEGSDAAERLRIDHHGEEVLAWGDVDSERVEALFR